MRTEAMRTDAATLPLRALAHLDGDTVPADALDVAAICHLPQVGSTMDVAHALAQGGAASGTLVLADAQTAGRGRSGAAWRSAPGAGVWMTLLVRGAAHGTHALDGGLLALRAGLVLADALAALAPAPLWLKWPNDLFCGTVRETAGKLAGVLVEARWQGGALGWVALGLGINRVAPPDDLPPGVAVAALGDQVSRTAVLRAAVPALVAVLRDAVRGAGPLSAAERAAWERRDLARGRRIAEPVAGTVTGVGPDGSLVVLGDGGVAHAVRAGSLRFA